jgi:hypothetical protein
MQEEISGVGIDPVCARTLKLLTAVAARKQANPKSSSPSSGEQIPDAVADDDRRADVGANPRCGGEKQVRSGLANRTSSRVISGVSGGSPSNCSAGRAAIANPLVAIAHGTR